MTFPSSFRVIIPPSLLLSCARLGSRQKVEVRRYNIHRQVLVLAFWLDFPVT
jgi:hypothetical protein